MIETITRTTIPTSERSYHVERLFGIYFPAQLEPYIFRTATDLSPDYTGGYWEFFELDNGGFYLAPESEGEYRVVSPNGFEGRMSGDAFGITACLFAYSHLSFVATKPASTTYARMYHALREYAMDHPEASAMLSATD
jgi:hypothetical protein